MHRSLTSLTVLAALALTACDTITGGDGDRLMGSLGSQPTAGRLAPGEVASVPSPNSEGLTPPSQGGGGHQLATPDTVLAHQPFDVVVRTYGSSGCWMGAGATLGLSAGTTEITPWDLDRSAGKTCTAAIVILPRVVRLTALEAGVHVVRLRGRGDGPDGVTSVERTIVVQ
jgi:hypothetical protein